MAKSNCCDQMALAFDVVMVLEQNILASKEAAKKWTTLFLRALPDCDDVEESVLVANLAYEELPANVELSVKQSEVITRNLCPKCEEKPLLAKKVDAQFAHDIYNRKAQGILNRSVAVAKRISASAKRDLEKALKTDDRVEISRALDRFIIKYRIQMADLLTTTQLAALLEGAREVAKSVPVVPLFPGASQVPATLEPKRAMELLDELRQLPVAEREQRIYLMPADQQAFARQGLLAQQLGGMEPPTTFTPASPMSGEPERVHYPIIDEAARSLAEKNVMTRSQFDTLDAAARQKAFTVAHVESLDTLAKIQDVLAETIEQGVDLQTFREKVIEAVGEGTFMSPWHLETVLRTNVQTAFSDGQMSVLQHPFVRSGFPYVEYAAIEDDRVRHDHLALESLGIDGGPIYKIDDPVFQLFRPPWAWNCFLPGTMVQGRFNVGLKSWYSGEVVEIVTRQGNRLTVTANHPILTANGFVAAHLLCKGDDVLSYGDGIENSTRNRLYSATGRNLKCRSKNNGPAAIEKVFDSLANLGSIGSFPLASHDFHGDAKFVVGNVQVVGTDRLLLDNVKAKRSNSIRDFGFSESNVLLAKKTSSGFSEFSNIASFGSNSSRRSFDDQFIPGGGIGFLERFDLQFLDIGQAAYLNASLYETVANRRVTAFESNSQVQESFASQISGNNFSGGNLNSQMANRNALPFAGSSELNASITQDSRHRAGADVRLARQLLDGNSGKITIDKIVSIVKRDFSHWVYDLQSPYGFMVANSIVTSNCRCSWIPMTVRMAASKGIQEAKDWLATGIEPSDRAFVPMPPFRPPVGFQRSLSGMPLSIRLSLESLGDYGARFAVKEKGHWITIGGSKGSDGERHGGSPVYVENGRITKGNPKLTGKKLGNLKGDDDQSTHRQLLGREKNYQRAVWAKKARKEGIDPKGLHWLADDMKKHHDANVDDVTSMLQSARKTAEKLGTSVSHLKAEFNKGDHTTIKDFDILARELAGEYPHLLGAHGYSHHEGYDADAEEASEKLFAFLKEGNPERMSEDQAYTEAFDYLLTQKSEEEPAPKKKRRKEVDESVPFSLGVQMGISAMFAQVHAPAGEPTVINGKTYQPGEFIPGDVLRSAPEPERKALLNTTHIRASDEGEILSHQEEGSYDASVAKDYKTSAAKTKFAGLDKEFGERAASYLSRHIQSEAEKFNIGISSLVDDGDWEDDGIKKVNTLRDAFAERIYDHADTYKRAITNHFKKRWQGRFSDERQKQLEDKLSELASSLEEQAYAIAGEIEENIASDTMDQKTWDAIANLEQETQDLTNYMSDAVNEIEDEMNAIVDAENEAEEERQQEFADTYFEDVQADVDGELSEDANDDEIRRAWEEVIRGYNAKINKDHPYRISLTDDGDLEVVLEDDLPEEFRPKKEAKLSVTSASGVQQFLGILRGDQ